MSTECHPDVAVLLATFNGAQFVEAQVKSLAQNQVRFTLHWLDDHSDDATKEIVRSCARSSGIELAEWHQLQRMGLPGSFFRLLECAEADIYLFCDQDDIWQPGKIDATVADLSADVDLPVLCFSDSLMFNDNDPSNFRLVSSLGRSKKSAGQLQIPRTLSTLTTIVAPGHTQGFTRSVREIFLRHNAIAHQYAFMHDWWIHDIAIASGSVRMLDNVPTTLWRRHASSFCESTFRIARPGFSRKWQSTQLWRRIKARHAQGFILAAPTIPAGSSRDQVLALAQLSATLGARQTPASLIELARRGAMPRSLYDAALFSMACLCSDTAPT